VVGFKGRLTFDASKPDGTPRKLLDVSRMKGLGWQAGISLREGLEVVYQEYSVTHAAAQERTIAAARAGE
jgi:GDP-L-fucose synthase